MPEEYYNLDKPFPLQGTLCAFDFGTKRIGVAVGQSITKTASPLPALSAKDGIPNWQDIKNIINKWRPEALVVGIPVNQGYENRQLEYAAKKFARRLKHRFKLPVFGVDEHLTSFAAKQALYEYGGEASLRKNSIDSIAATLILENWFNKYY